MTRVQVQALSVGLLVLASTNACSNNLTRKEAKRALEAKYVDEPRYYEITTGQYGPFQSPEPYINIRSGQLRTDLADIAALSDAGFVTINTIASGVPVISLFYSGAVDHIVIAPTEKAKPFRAGVFPLGTRGCNEGCIQFVAARPTITIRGVTEPASAGGRVMSIVSFVVSWTNTQVGDIVKRHYQDDENKSTFVRYDDGWRLEK